MKMIQEHCAWKEWQREDLPVAVAVESASAALGRVAAATRVDPCLARDAPRAGSVVTPRWKRTFAAAVASLSLHLNHLCIAVAKVVPSFAESIADVAHIVVAAHTHTDTTGDIAPIVALGVAVAVAVAVAAVATTSKHHGAAIVEDGVDFGAFLRENGLLLRFLYGSEYHNFVDEPGNSAIQNRAVVWNVTTRLFPSLSTLFSRRSSCRTQETGETLDFKIEYT